MLLSLLLGAKSAANNGQKTAVNEVLSLVTLNKNDWSMNNEWWTINKDQWSMNNDWRTMNKNQESMINEPWTTKNELLTINNEQWK